VVREDFMFRPFVLAGAIAALTFHAAAAQQPTQAQRDAIRASCRSDFMANCSGVTPGGKEALECLLRNQAKLSPVCNSAVRAIMPAKAPAAPAAAEAPAPAASSPAPAESEPAKNEPAKNEPAKSEPANREPAPPQPAAAAVAEPAAKSPAAQEAQLKTVRQSCTLNDFMAHCSWIKPDNPELLLCLQANASDLSQPCQAAVQGQPQPTATSPAALERKAATKGKKSTASREPAATPAPSSAPATSAPAAAPTEAQKSAIRAACRSDFMANCSGVTPGGAEALQCLKSHAASLSAACQGAVAATGGGAGGTAASAASSAASAAGAPAASAPSPAVAPLGPIPPMRPRDAIGILAMCRAEHESLCSDVPLGGGRVLTCLAQHAEQLSLACYEALSRATR
jgi:hypothetical protein